MNKVALVTGAGKGLGLEFTKQLLQCNYKVLACLRDTNKYKSLIDLQSKNENLKLLSLDISSEESINSLVEKIKLHTDHLDLLINSAGINSKSNHPYSQSSSLLFGQLEQESLLNQFKVNAIGPLLLTQSLVQLFEKAKKAKVVNISSWLSSIEIKQSGGNYGYCASKTALNMMNKALSFDLANYGAISVCFNPGWVRTDMGGLSAKLSPEESVSGILEKVATLSLEESGSFLQWEGSEHPW